MERLGRRGRGTATAPDGAPRPRAGAAHHRRTCGKVMHAPDETLELCVLCLFAEGHLIIEDFPGVGKTTLAKALARSVDLLVLAHPVHARPAAVGRHRRQRLQPAARTSSSSGPGPVFANVLLVDEINRASPKTQAALLECDAGAPGHGRRRHVSARRGRSWSWRRRTRSSTRAPTRCPRRSSTASRCGSRSAIRRSRTRRGCSRSRRPRRRSSRSTPVASAAEVLGGDRGRASASTWRRACSRYVVGAAPRDARGQPALPGREPAGRDRPAPRREGSRARRERDYVIPDDVKAVAPAVLVAPADPRARGPLGRARRRGRRPRGRRANAGPGVGRPC